jgi:hypothetical protein
LPLRLRRRFLLWAPMASLATTRLQVPVVLCTQYKHPVIGSCYRPSPCHSGPSWTPVKARDLKLAEAGLVRAPRKR